MNIQGTKLLAALILLLFIGCSNNKEATDKTNEPAKKSADKISLNNIDLLFDASLNGDIETVKKYIENGYDVNQQNQDKQSLLMLAGFNGHTALCEYLIKKGAHVDARDANGRTPLMFASTGPFPKTVELLLENNADVNAVGHLEKFTPLMHAASEGQLEVVKILLEHGADPSLKDVDGDTAESFAVQKGHNEVVKYLRKNK